MSHLARMIMQSNMLNLSVMEFKKMRNPWTRLVQGFNILGRLLFLIYLVRNILNDSDKKGAGDIKKWFV